MTNPYHIPAWCLIGIAVFLCGAVVPHTTHAASTAAIERAISVLMPEAPEMVAIARCESGLRQYTDSGAVLRGGLGNQMIGLFQFHEAYHRAAARALGLNIDSLIGNIAYARTLYQAQGTTPWNSSAHCWRTDAAPIASAPSAPQTVTTTLYYGVRHPEVRLLKEALVQAKHLAPPPASSLTDEFDRQTLKAVLAFQCAEGLACLHTTAGVQGIGRVQGTTRTRINELLQARTAQS